MKDKLVCAHVGHMIWQADVRTCIPLLDFFPKPVKHKRCLAASSKEFIGHVTHSADFILLSVSKSCSENHVVKMMPHS